MTDPDWPSRHAEPGKSPGFRMWRDFMRWQRGLNAVLRPVGLTQPQFAALAIVGWLTRTTATTSQQAVIDLSDLDRMHVSQLLARLERDGLIRRETAAGDQRAKDIALTTKGRETLARALPLVEAFDAEFFMPQPGP
jgi:MarR family transcriptional regulator, organic hydroperoxide resistance regulator